MGELLLIGVVIVVAAVLVLRATRGARFARLAVFALLGVFGLVGAARPRREPAVPAGAPRQLAREYVSSAACLACHPGEHASFARTYHRTMTQLATPQTVLAPIDPLVPPRFERRGEEIWVTMPDPEAEIEKRPAAEITRRVLLTTGSHREQAYWIAGRRRNDLRLVPFVWLPEDRALVPRRDAFLNPPDQAQPPVRWASSCIACHAVAGEPRHDVATDAFDTRAAELGVACEACHGPGAAHVDRHRDPVVRFTHDSTRADPTIIQPRRLSPERSAAVCGQCHAYAFPRDEAQWWTDGYAKTYRAGDALEPSRTLIDPDGVHGKPGAPVVDAPADAIFWPDGAVRVGGREYNGLVASPCWEQGKGDRKPTCLSCHSMHAGPPAGQIALDRADDRACTQCHDDARAKSHSHHATGSPGSACVSCHMPKTSYALLEAVRSHRIESPSAENTATTGKPNACNLCHLDRSLAWTARTLAAWYGSPLGTITNEAPAGLVAAISGDAGVRALLADALGSRDTAAPPAFRAPILDAMASDPYAAVRFIASRSRRRIPGPAAPLDPAVLRPLLAARDDRAITIAE